MQAHQPYCGSALNCYGNSGHYYNTHYSWNDFGGYYADGCC
ncbi:hypothetical protein J2Z69_001143 [Paenibacillus shirakamiensis]|uniref:Uncharacterized protein n=1 Tax=Paenibacillus shirakamiensis TaxID=1265935 RepID=A0ABS4JEI0_9BACL|nr:hypothetical protein [Paenibacillus shirakamiensis]MBP2000124.1 hypothetical protein [Paenibacillus shirakamiensis]